jgi:hypothetical protein
MLKLPFIVTQNTKLQWLQYSINQRILGTNKFLYKIKIKDNAFCTFCQEDEETIDTMLFLISNKYISLVPLVLFKMVLTNEGINGVSSL